MGPTDVARRLFGDRGLHVSCLDTREASYAPVSRPLHPALEARLAGSHRTEFYEHQANAIDHALAGDDLMVVTGTNSGKSLCYNVPVIDACLREPMARALYLFPTKALAQDQATKLRELLPESLHCALYDGDTPRAKRTMIRKSAHILLSNPDMLHVGILPSNELWRKFFASLRYIVLDEAHVYRGVFGSHMSSVLRRLLRLCAWHNSRPQIIACSATVANAAEHFLNLTGREARVVDRDTSPRGQRQVVLVEPPEDDDYSPNKDTSALLAEFVCNGVRTIAFCRSRVTTELVVKMTREALGKFGQDPKLVESYRSGYTADERRSIERALATGKVAGLVATNAMELGVDIGGLDAVIINGYPGSVGSFWQQSGRAGRGKRAGFSVMLAGADPLDRFLTHHPELVFDRTTEQIPLNPNNAYILEAQLRCAAYERPIGQDELMAFGPGAGDAVNRLVDSGELEPQRARYYFRSYESPAKKVSLRGTSSDSVLLQFDGQPLGEMEAERAKRQAHTGAVYLHRGEAYMVQELDLARNVAHLDQFDGDYYTLPVVQNLVESTMTIRHSGPARLDGVRVTSTVRGFTRWAIKGNARMGEEELQLPSDTFETVGVRVDLPDLGLEDAAAVHGLEHALLAVAPLIADCDRNDLGACWFMMAPDTLKPAVYAFDATPGGVGLTEALSDRAADWARAALDLLEGCRCADGCPACLLSSRCESANELLSKPLALSALRSLISCGLQ